MKNFEFVSVRGDFNAACDFARQPGRKIKIYPEQQREGHPSRLCELRTPVELDVVVSAFAPATYRVLLVGEKGLTRDSVTVQLRDLDEEQAEPAEPAEQQPTE